MDIEHRLRRIVGALDRIVVPPDDRTIASVCTADPAEHDIRSLDPAEARAILSEIDAKSSALIAVLAIVLATSAFVYSLSKSLFTVTLFLLQFVTVTVSILFLIRCLVYEPLPHRLGMGDRAEGFDLQTEAMKRVIYFNWVILMTFATTFLFVLMSVWVIAGGLMG